MRTRSRKHDSERELAASVIRALERWQDRLEDHVIQKRRHERRRVHARMEAFPVEEGEDVERALRRPGLTIWSCNISPAGLAFVFRGRIGANRIVVCLDPDAGRRNFVETSVVRARRVHSDFWEYGVKFLGRVEPPMVTAAPHSAASPVRKNAPARVVLTSTAGHRRR